MKPIDKFKLRIIAGTLFSIWFWAIYIGCDYLARGFDTRYDIRISADSHVPFVPAFSYIYMGVNLILVLPIIIIKNTQRYLSLAVTLAAEVALAGIVYLVFPVEPSISPQDPGNQIMRWADMVNLTYNGFPSLHVALSVTSGLALLTDLERFWKVLTACFVFAIFLSTLFTHQHFILESLSGLLLAGLGYFVLLPVIYDRIKSSID